MKTLIDTNAVDRIINITNQKLRTWYEQVKEDYQIDGKANAFLDFESKNLCVKYTEDSKEKLFNYPLLYVMENMEFSNLGEEYFFELWASMAE